MHLAHSAEQLALRDELQTYFATLMTEDRVARLGKGEHAGGPTYREIVRQMGDDGWLGVGWPKEYGGQDFTPIEQYIFFDEAQRGRRARSRSSRSTPSARRIAGVRHRGAEGRTSSRRSSAARCTSRSATPSPRPAPTSPRSRRRAVRDGDEWVINGQKIWTTSRANDADYVWLAARTDPDAPKHKGITIFIVPTRRARVLASSPI